MSELELITAAVVGWAVGNVGNIASAPAQALAEHWKGRVLARLNGTAQKAKAKAEAQGSPMEPNERVAFKALSEAAFNDDEIVSDYLGGVLAASGLNDDAGAAIVAAIGRLSSLQLRLHYVIYRELRRLWPADIALNLYEDKEARRPSSDFRFRISSSHLASHPSQA